MDTNVFMGMLIAAIVVLAGLAVALVTLVVKPVTNVSTKLTNLTDSLEHISEVTSNLDKRVTRHGEVLDEHSVKLAKVESELKHLEGGR